MVVAEPQSVQNPPAQEKENNPNKGEDESSQPPPSSVQSQQIGGKETKSTATLSSSDQSGAQENKDADWSGSVGQAVHEAAELYRNKTEPHFGLKADTLLKSVADDIQAAEAGKGQDLQQDIIDNYHALQSGQGIEQQADKDRQAIVHQHGQLHDDLKNDNATSRFHRVFWGPSEHMNGLKAHKEKALGDYQQTLDQFENGKATLADVTRSFKTAQLSSQNVELTAAEKNQANFSIGAESLQTIDNTLARGAGAAGAKLGPVGAAITVGLYTGLTQGIKNTVRFAMGQETSFRQDMKDTFLNGVQGYGIGGTAMLGGTLVKEGSIGLAMASSGPVGRELAFGIATQPLKIALKYGLTAAATGLTGAASVPLASTFARSDDILAKKKDDGSFELIRYVPQETYQDLQNGIIQNPDIEKTEMQDGNLIAHYDRIKTPEGAILRDQNVRLKPDNWGSVLNSFELSSTVEDKKNWSFVLSHDFGSYHLGSDETRPDEVKDELVVRNRVSYNPLTQTASAYRREEKIEAGTVFTGLTTSNYGYNVTPLTGGEDATVSRHKADTYSGLYQYNSSHRNESRVEASPKKGQLNYRHLAHDYGQEYGLWFQTRHYKADDIATARLEDIKHAFIPPAIAAEDEHYQLYQSDNEKHAPKATTKKADVHSVVEDYDSTSTAAYTVLDLANIYQGASYLTAGTNSDYKAYEQSNFAIAPFLEMGLAKQTRKPLTSEKSQ
jgi:hypothetical protein